MEAAALWLLGVVVIGVGVAASIALHEVGHLLPAKRFGVRCTQYMIGFGPTVWSRRRGETEYGVKAVPLGGYVRMIGMFPPKPGRPARADSTGRVGMLVDQARRDAQREIGPEDGDRLFYQRSVPKRLVIMLGGPVMNLVIAVFLFTLLLTTYGTAEYKPVVGSVSQCVVPVTDGPAPTTCPPSSSPTPAAAAGLQAGDRIVEFAGTPIGEWQTLQRLIRANPGRTVPVVVERSGRQVALQVTLVRDNRAQLDRWGNEVVDSRGRTVLVPVGFLGITPVRERQPVPLTAVPARIGGFLAQTAAVVVRIPQKMVGVVNAATGRGERDPNGPISILGVGRIAGEVGAAQGTADNPISFTDKMVQWLGLIAGLNLALFVFNLLPLLPLDGGHVAGALWEGLRRQVARLRHRPDPGPVDTARLLPLTYVVASILLTMSVLLMYADIVNPVRLTG